MTTALALVDQEPTSVFASVADSMYELIDVTIVFRDRLVGGQPKDPKLVEGWLKAKTGITDDDEIRAMMRSHLLEVGIEGAAQMTQEDLTAAAEKASSEIAERKTQGFKRDAADRPVIEARHLKAGIKECVNILFAGDKWGSTRKGPKGFTAERVFVEPGRIPVGLASDVLVDLAVGHITGPSGPMSTIGYYEYVEKAEASFTIKQLLGQSRGSRGEPSLSYDQWARVFAHMELNGIGAMRSQSFGQFVVTRFEVRG